MSKDRMKLKDVSTLLVDSEPNANRLMQQMLRGLGMEMVTTADSISLARSLLETKAFDMMIIEAELPDGSGSELVSWLRRLTSPIRFIPVLVATPYSHMRNVARARDAGASLVIKKPVSPQVLYEHISWAASSTRNFIESEGYVGPDRRFKFLGPPGGVGRRESDLAGDIGAATEPNMSQDEIDALIKPTKVMAIG